MAQITDLPDEITPSTPPDTTNESNQLRTPTTQPGFKPTQTVSRGALVSASPAPATHQSRLPQKNKRISVINSDNEDDDEDHSQNTDKGRNPFAGTKKVASRTGRKVVIDMAQDSDGGGPKQEPNDPAWACRWCPDQFKASGGSYWNLQSHQEGLIIKGTLWNPCPGRSQAVEAGAYLPPTATKVKSKASKDQPNGPGTLTAYATKPRYDNQTLNKLLVIWVIRQSPPWLRVKDFLLRVSFDYGFVNTQLNLRVWAALHAHLLYLEQRGQVLKAIKTTDSGSNNFTMAKGVSSIFCAVDSTDWDVEKNHHRCICCWNLIPDSNGTQRTPKRMRVIGKDVTEKEDSSSIGIPNRSLPDDAQQKNTSLLNRISTAEKPITSEHYNHQKQEIQIRNRIE
ncbi:hypothetical protein MJO29_001228 [Puccinia striiformis f. sp. tritici]|nr:hypothetical protein MJO29_001228 [Puccinia striiformis f. sp. tritici]